METIPSRRSSSNLSLAHLSIPPLSAKAVNAPAEDSVYDRSPYHPGSSYVPGSSYIPSGSYYVPSTSYLSGKSAPTTPGILSRSTSPVRKTSKSYTHLAFANNSSVEMSWPRHKSNITLTTQPDASRHRQRKAQKSSNDASEWLFRAGAAIAGQTQEEKGQSWLASRASSTSLAAAQQDGGIEARERIKDDEQLAGIAKTYSTRAARDYSRNGSRAVSAANSRIQSRFASRVGSRTGSRADLPRFSALSNLDDASLTRRTGRDDYFDSTKFAGPDFVDGTEEEEEEADARQDDDEEAKRQEQEVEHLAKQRGFGLGSVVDKLVGWTVFDTREKGEKSGDEDEAETEELTEAQKQARLRKSVSERLTQSIHQGQVVGKERSKGEEEASGWQDAAWLMSVASKALF